MTETRGGGDGSKWYSVFVPPTERQTGTGAEAAPARSKSYVRLGDPDAVVEAGFVSGLEARYGDTAGQALADLLRPGIVHHTEGDSVHFIEGRCDTRVLNDSFMVYVLDPKGAKSIDELPPDAPKHPKSHRSYLRLGKEHEAIEKSFGQVAPSVLKIHVEAIAPDTNPSELREDVERASVLAEAEGISALGERLHWNATRASRDAIRVLDELRTSTDARAKRAYRGSRSVNAWALGVMRGVHTSFSDSLVARAAEEAQPLPPPRPGEIQQPRPTRWRDVVEARAGVDPEVRRALKEMRKSGNDAAKAWAGDVLGRNTKETPGKFSLGTGIAMFSDDPITLTTPSALKVTVGSDSRTVLGETFSKTYDVDDETLTKIRLGEIKTEDQISGKLVTAELKCRSTPFWRTTKFDLSKKLDFSVTDSGKFEISSAYAFSAGLSFKNGASASLDATAGVSVSLPLAFKVELNEKQTKTTFNRGTELVYKDTQNLSGRTLTLETDTAYPMLQEKMGEFATVMRVAMLVVNATAMAYTFAVTAIGAEDQSRLRDTLEDAEDFYAAITAINAVALAASVVAGVMQMYSKVAQNVQNAGPIQSSNVVVNNQGIKLQCGRSYIAIDATSIVLSAPLIVQGGTTRHLPGYVPGNATSPGLKDLLDKKGVVARPGGVAFIV